MRVSSWRCVSLAGWLCLTGFAVNAQTWRQVGPSGGDVQSLAAVPGSTRTLFLGTSDGHIFGSSDAGEHWQILGRIGENHDDVIMSIVVDPRAKDTLYATSWTLGSHGGGVYRSGDAGHNWQLIGLGGQVVRAIAFAPSNPDILIAGALDGVYRSSDAGKSWMRISPENHEDLRNFDSIAIDPRDADTIYAGTYHLPWKTADGGKTWLPIHQGMVDDSDVMSITIDQNNPDHVFASACSGIYHSADGGANWTKFKGIPASSRRTVHILQDPKRPLTVYAATTEGLWKTVDDGATWKMITPVSWSILSMEIDPQNSDRLILGTERLGLQVSDDGGQTYRASNQGFSHRRIVDAATDPQHPERAIVVLTSSFEPVLETNDGGYSWTPLAAGLKSGPPQRVFASPDGWFAAPGPGGLLRYDRMKSEWVPTTLVVEKIGAVHTAPAVKKVATHSKAAPTSSIVKTIVPFRSVVNDMDFTRDAWYAATDGGLLVSTDRGLNWTAMPSTTLQSSAAVTPGKAPVRAIHAERGSSRLWAVTAAQLEMSSDAGKTWISHTLPFENRGSIHFYANEHAVLLGGNRGVFVSQDNGVSWRQGTLPEMSIEEIAAAGDAIMISTAKGGLYISRDSGRTWGRMQAPAGSELSAMHPGQSSRQMVVASATEGMYLLDLPAGSSAASDAAASSPFEQ